MQKFRDAVASLTGAPVGGASVQVNIQSTGLPATIYSDNGVTVATNPLTTDAITGAFSFYAADGRYQLVISGANITTTTINDIELFDMAGAINTTSLPSASGKIWNNGGALSVS